MTNCSELYVWRIKKTVYMINAVPNWIQRQGPSEDYLQSESTPVNYNKSGVLKVIGVLLRCLVNNSECSLEVKENFDTLKFKLADFYSSFKLINCFISLRTIRSPNLRTCFAIPFKKRETRAIITHERRRQWTLFGTLLSHQTKFKFSNCSLIKIIKIRLISTR